MLHLRRVLFASVGHRDARLAPLTLPFTGADGRPAHTVLWLRNGGGKSSMLNLIFAVLRPDRREFLGNDESGRDRHLGDYVLADDTAHVVLEWGHPGQRTPGWVTGMVLEWRDRTRSTDRDRLRRLWYGFVPTPLDGRLIEPDDAFTVDTLPITDGGARLSLGRFRDRLRDTGAADPGLEMVVTDVQSDWRRALEQRRLDPEVFRYQLQMNREEGGASQLFKRRSRTAEGFVDLLLELALPDEQPGRVAAVFGLYADELAQRPVLERNRAFLTGALERLRPLVAAAGDRNAAEARLEAQVGQAARLAASLAGAAVVAGEDAAARSREAARLLESAREVEAERDRLREATAAAQRIAAEERVADAEAARGDAEAIAGGAQAAVRAWRVAEVLAASTSLDAEVAELETALAAAEADAAPLRRRRDEAARRLAMRLAADERELALDADRARVEAGAAERAADAAAERRAELAAAGGRVDSELRVIAARREVFAAELAACERDGLVAAAEDAATAARRVADEAAEVEAERATLDQRAAALSAAERELEQRRDRLERRAGESALQRAQARSALARLEEREAGLSADPRLVAVAETDRVELPEAGTVLAERLAGLAAEADRRLLDIELAAAADRRALAALDGDGLLPARQDVEAVRDLLVAGGVAAVTGWAYLADRVPAAGHAALLAAHPEMVDGVVVLDAAQLGRAEALLAQSGLRASSAVVVSADGAVTDPSAAPSGDRRAFVVPVASALWDRVAGEAERTRRAERLETVDERTAAVRAERERDAALAARLTAFLGDYPAVEAERIRQTAAARDAAYAEVRDQQEALGGEVARIRAERGALEAARREVELRAVRLERIAARLARLADRAAEDRADAERQAALSAEADEVREGLAGAREREREGRLTARERTEVAASRQAAAARLAEERARLGLPKVEADAEVPAEPADQLAKRWRLLDERYRKKVTQPVLADRHQRATAERARRRAELGRSDDADRDHAGRLLATPDGAEPGRRAAALAEAERRREVTARALGAAEQRLAAAQAELAALGPRHADPDLLPERPETAEAAQRLAERLEAEAQTQSVEARGLRSAADDAQRQADARRTDAERLSGLVERVEVALDGHPWADVPADAASVQPFAADPAAARRAADEVQRDLRAAVTAAQTDRKRAAAADAALRAFALDRRYESVDGPLRDRLGRDPAPVLAERAGDYIDDMEVRRAQCEQQLEGLARHRDLLVREIAARVDEALHLLRQAERASALPDGFGDWSGQQFLHVRFDRAATDDELFARLAALVDEIVDRGERPEGLPLVQRAVAAAVGSRGFTVRILKPNAALRTERVPVSDLATFSGGEQLTAAVLLYCTLSQLRARVRGQRGTGGMLVLDNPIGKSSNVTLLDLQRRVADGLGVQLVYTTAVDDRDAVAALPNRIRLRNERMDRRTGNQHVELEPAGDADVVSRVTAARLWRREDAAESGGDEVVPASSEEAETA